MLCKEKDLVWKNIPALTKAGRISVLLHPLFSFRFIIFCALFLSFNITACMPVKDEKINTELFKSQEDMRKKTRSLTYGMAHDDVFDFLNIPVTRFESMSTAQIQTVIYGRSQVQGTPEQLEKFRQRMQKYQGYSLPYRSIKNKSSFGLGKMKYKKTGHDLRLILVFEDDQLIKANVIGTSDIQQQENKYMWNNLLKSGVSAAF